MVHAHLDTSVDRREDGSVHPANAEAVKSQLLPVNVGVGLQVVDGAAEVLGPTDNQVSPRAGPPGKIKIAFIRSLIDGVQHGPAAAEQELNHLHFQFLAGFGGQGNGAGEIYDGLER